MSDHGEICTEMSGKNFDLMLKHWSYLFSEVNCEKCRSVLTLSTMIHIYAKMSPDLRSNLFHLFQDIAIKMDGEAFEDNHDFSDFMCENYGDE